MIKFLWFTIQLSIVFLFAQNIWAASPVLFAKDDLRTAVLNEASPGAFAPFDFQIEDFQIHWVGNKPENVSIEIDKRSLQWVRVNDFLVLPRATVKIKIAGATTGWFENGRTIQILSHSKNDDFEGAQGHGLIFLATQHQPDNIRFERDGKLTTASFRFQLHSRKPEPAIALDSSCSPYEMTVESNSTSIDQWAYIGCRRIITQRDGDHASMVEVTLFWSGVEDNIEINGDPTLSTAPSLWVAGLNPNEKEINFNSSGRSIHLKYNIPDKTSLGSLGVGIGPYWYNFQNGFDNKSGIVPSITLYGSYFLSESARLVAFSATDLSPQYYTDFGIYFKSESFRAFDSRLSLSLLLGGHVVGLQDLGQYIFRVGFPQGVEIVISDVFRRNANLTFGGFFYPEIQGKSYTNAWLRWGSPRVFGEVNYISWQENVMNQSYFSQSWGVSLGLPLIHFL